MMKLAILAAPGLIPYLSDKLESTGQAAGVKLDLYDYGHLSMLPELYPKLRDKYDGFLLSGLVVQTAIQRYFPEDDKPVAAFDTELEEIYHALLDLLDMDRSLDLTKVVVDIYLQVNEKHNCRALLDIKDMDAARQKTMDYWKNISLKEIEGLGDRLFAQIKRRWEAGEITYVISRNSSVQPKLMACGIPHTFLYPSEKQLLRTVHGLLRQITAQKSADYMAAAVVVARESVKGLVEADEEEELLLQQAVLDYKKETLADFQIQKTTNGLFLFTNLKTVSRMTGNFRHCGLSHYLQRRLRFCTYVAYGVAPELSTAKSSALEALREGVYRKAVYAVVEDSLVGPLMPETEPLKQVPLDEDLMEIAGKAMLAPGTVRKIKTILGIRGNNEITAAELAERLNVKIRHTNHIIERLTTAGYAVQTGMKSTGTKGRPTRIYRIDI